MKEERTEINLTPEKPFHFKGKFNISFDLNLRMFYDQGYGYVLRVIQNDTMNIDVVYKFNINDGTWHFYLVSGQQTAEGSYRFNELLQLNEWISFDLEFAPDEDKIILSCAGRQISSIANELDSEDSYKMFFGACDYKHFKTRDVPAMSIRDIKISSDKGIRYHWTLNEDSGTQSIDKIEQQKALVRNPNWLKPKHENWLEIYNNKIAGHAQVTIDQEKEILYIVGSEKLIVYHLLDDTNEIINYSNSPAQLVGGQLFINPIDSGLYSYDVDNQTINKFDFEKKQWAENKVKDKEFTVFLHHNKQFSMSDSCLYIIGGYGQHEYKNSILKLNLKSHQWESLEIENEAFNPRYLAASGFSNDTIYILGGYGSPGGSQMLNPQIYSDLLAFSIGSQQFSREMAVDLPSPDICFANSMVVFENTRTYYALAFQLFASENYLQLVQGSLDNPTMNTMANKMPYLFHDVRSYANLFYFPKSNKLLSYTSFLEEDGETSIQLYSLLFPPNISKSQKGPDRQSMPDNQLLTIIIVSIIAGIFLLMAVIYFRKRNSNRSIIQTDRKDASIPNDRPVNNSMYKNETSPKSSILFFGGFQVYDKNGIDITGKFTPLLKELFLLLWINTLKENKGISSEKLTEILWFDKSPESARNNKSVNIAKLRAILLEIGDCEITHKTGYWKIIYNDQKIFNDYKEFLMLTQSKSNLNKQSILQLISIAEKGAILLNMNYSWLDEFKASISEKLIETLYSYAKKLEIQEDPNLVIQIADCIFNCDSINEEAMVLKCKAQHVMGSHSISKSTYSKFCKSYIELYDQEYDTSFSDVINLPLEDIVNY